MHNRDVFLIFFNVKVFCVYLLESPHRGDPNEYTQYTNFNIKQKNHLNYPRSAAMGYYPKGLKNVFETAVVNEPSVFELLKFYTCFQVIHDPSLFYSNSRYLKVEVQLLLLIFQGTVVCKCVL